MYSLFKLNYYKKMILLSALVIMVSSCQTASSRKMSGATEGSEIPAVSEPVISDQEPGYLLKSAQSEYGPGWTETELDAEVEQNKVSSDCGTFTEDVGKVGPTMRNNRRLDGNLGKAVGTWNMAGGQGQISIQVGICNNGKSCNEFGIESHDLEVLFGRLNLKKAFRKADSTRFQFSCNPNHKCKMRVRAVYPGCVASKWSYAVTAIGKAKTQPETNITRFTRAYWQDGDTCRRYRDRAVVQWFPGSGPDTSHYEIGLCMAPYGSNGCTGESWRTAQELNELFDAQVISVHSNIYATWDILECHDSQECRARVRAHSKKSGVAPSDWVYSHSNAIPDAHQFPDSYEGRCTEFDRVPE